MPAQVAALAGKYFPRGATNQLKEIVDDNLEALLRIYDERYRSRYGPFHPRVKSLLERYVRCGDPHFGFLRLRCTNPECPCKGERIVPFSCKARGICESCGQRRAVAWAERMVDDVLPDVAYAQIVFTIPKMLRGGFLWDRTLYGDLCRSAYAATRKFFEAQFPALEKPVPAMVAAPQSFGDLLGYHPHCHSICSLGVFSRDAVFHSAPDDIDFAPLEVMFREEFFKALLKKEKITQERIDLLRSWRHSGFQTFTDRRVAKGDRQGLESLLQYIERPPVSLKRLRYLREEGRVFYSGKFNPTLGRDHQLVSGLEFLAMLVAHIALRYECRVFCYGAISTTIRRKFGWVRKEGGEEKSGGAGEVTIAEEESEFVKLRKRNWARLISKVYLENPSLCPSCGKPMKIISALSSPHSGDVIERILRARGEWDPPWQRAGKIRGPPRQLEFEEAEFSQVAPASGDEFDQTVPFEDEFDQTLPGGELEF